ncbi:MAG: protein-glutamate O-methyltransferase [candidate division FCPU426 bacterium]
MISSWLGRKKEDATAMLSTPELTASDFKAISTLVMERCGIHLHSGKQELVKARLGKRLRTLGFETWRQYLNLLKEDESGDEITSMLDAISTNLTYFFRENSHFDFLAQTILPAVVATADKRGRKLRIWSAGCSTGEEPYTIALVLSECIPDLDRWDAKILATDLSTRVLAKAKNGHYEPERLQDLPHTLRSKYFFETAVDGQTRFQVRPELRRLVHFARLNFMESWPLRGPFDVIFCRNVMIYFTHETRNQMIRQFWSLLPMGGYFLIGHSESLTGLNHEFKYLKPSTYQKT